MVREKIRVSTRTLQWKCVESRTDSKCLYYGRFILSPLMKGQADTIGIAMRRALLGEMEGTCITRAKSEKIPHEYSTIVGIQESVHEILMNLKEILLRSNLYGTCEASIYVRGPRCVTAQDIILPPYVEIVDNTQHIANLTEPIDLCIGLQLERNRGYNIKAPNIFQDGNYPIDGLFMPVRNVNHSIHSYGNGTEKQEILFLEIWTNGSLTPKEALYEASRNLINLLIPFLHAEEENLELHLADNQQKVSLPLFTVHDRLTQLSKNKTKIALKSIFIDQLELPPRIYNCLKKSNIHTLADLLNTSQKDLIKIEHFDIEDVKKIVDTLEKHFGIDLDLTKTKNKRCK
uniref:RNA polymerase alpha subunit n=2 Tax=Gypsophila TaxID=146094 RepID=UPI0030DF42C6